MTSLLRIAAVGALLVTTEVAIFPVAALAQSGSPSEIIVYGNDPCPRQADDDIVICTRRPEEERYRIAPNLRPSGTRQERSSWANRAQELNNVGNTGIGSCSAVGPGGSTGCLIQDINRAMQENREAAEQGTAPER
jgi:hypothetical protein